MTKQPNLLLRLICNNCNAIIGENKEKPSERYARPTYSFGLMACCGSTPNSAFTLSVLNANEDIHLYEQAGGYFLVNAPEGMVRNTRLTDAYLHRLTYETICDTGRAELYVDHRRVGAVWLSHQDDEPYFSLNFVPVYLKDIDKVDEYINGGGF